MFLNLSLYFVTFSLKGSELPKKILSFDNMIEHKWFKDKPHGQMILSPVRQTPKGQASVRQAVSSLTHHLLILTAPCIYKVTSNFNLMLHHAIFVSGRKNNFHILL